MARKFGMGFLGVFDGSPGDFSGFRLSIIPVT